MFFRNIEKKPSAKGFTEFVSFLSIDPPVFIKARDADCQGGIDARGCVRAQGSYCNESTCRSH